jgi:hypothetical protein
MLTDACVWINTSLNVFMLETIHTLWSFVFRWIHTGWWLLVPRSPAARLPLPPRGPRATARCPRAIAAAPEAPAPTVDPSLRTSSSRWAPCPLQNPSSVWSFLGLKTCNSLVQPQFFACTYIKKSRSLPCCSDVMQLNFDSPTPVFQGQLIIYGN